MRLQALIDQNLGAYHDASPLWHKVQEFGAQGTTYSLSAVGIQSLLGEHDLAAARLALQEPEPEGALNPGSHALDRAWATMLVAFATEQWDEVIVDDGPIQALFSKYPGLRSYAPVRELPWLALAQARLGNFKAAELLIAQTPEECDICLRTRAQLAVMQKQNARADLLFAKAVQAQPEAPFAEADWGAALLARGDVDGAIARLMLASQKGPRFADPLEVWGEALLRKGDSAGAADKFAAANGLAPQWGRSHLRLGQALLKLERGEEARKEFALAATLELSATERAELASLSGSH